MKFSNKQEAINNVIKRFKQFAQMESDFFQTFGCNRSQCEARLCVGLTASASKLGRSLYKTTYNAPSADMAHSLVDRVKRYRGVAESINDLRGVDALRAARLLFMGLVETVDSYWFGFPNLVAATLDIATTCYLEFRNLECELSNCTLWLKLGCFALIVALQDMAMTLLLNSNSTVRTLTDIYGDDDVVLFEEVITLFEEDIYVR